MKQLEDIEDTRSVVFAIFFLVPMLLLILGTSACCLKNKCCFKINYILAFLLAVVTWILFAFFNVTVVLWADTCVRLDQMEMDVKGSKLLDQMYTDDMIKNAIDTCLHGKYVPDAFNVTGTFDFKALKEKLNNNLTLDVVSAYDVESIIKLENFVGTLDVSDYQFTVNKSLDFFNSKYQSQITNSPVVRNDLKNNGALGLVKLASITNPRERFAAQQLFSKIVDIYKKEQLVQTRKEFEEKVQNFTTDSNRLINQLDDLKNYSINVIQKDLTAIKCSLNPLWDNMDKLLYSNNTAFCAQVGVQYGQMKSLSCERLFGNFEHTNRSLLIIAVFSTFIGFLSVALGRRIHKRFNIFEQKTHDFGNNRANTSMFFS